MLYPVALAIACAQKTTDHGAGRLISSSGLRDLWEDVGHGARSLAATDLLWSIEAKALALGLRRLRLDETSSPPWEALAEAAEDWRVAVADAADLVFSGVLQAGTGLTDDPVQSFAQALWHSRRAHQHARAVATVVVGDFRGGYTPASVEVVRRAGDAWQSMGDPQVDVDRK